MIELIFRLWEVSWATQTDWKKPNNIFQLMLATVGGMDWCRERVVARRPVRRQVSQSPYKRWWTD